MPGAGGFQGKKMPGGSGSVAPVPDESDEGREYGEVAAGLRCKGCGQRFKRGFEFVRVQVVKDPLAGGKRATMKSTTIACSGIDGCEFAVEAAQTATAVRPVEPAWMFMDDPKLAGWFNRAEEG